MSNIVPQMHEPLIRRDTLWYPSGFNTWKMDMLLPMQWGPLLTRCLMSLKYMQNPPSMMTMSPSSQGPIGSMLPCMPMNPTGKFYTRRFTSWPTGALLLISKGIVTSLGLWRGFVRILSLCRGIWRGPAKWWTCVSIGFKQLRLTNTSTRCKASSTTEFSLVIKMSEHSKSYARMTKARASHLATVS